MSTPNKRHVLSLDGTHAILELEQCDGFTKATHTTQGQVNPRQAEQVMRWLSTVILEEAHPGTVVLLETDLPDPQAKARTQAGNHPRTLKGGLDDDE